MSRLVVPYGFPCRVCLGAMYGNLLWSLGARKYSGEFSPPKASDVWPNSWAIKAATWCPKKAAWWTRCQFPFYFL